MEDGTSGIRCVEDPSRPRTERIELGDGTRLHALLWEPAAPSHPVGVLCVHGLASNALLWAGMAQHLAASGHRVVAVDLRSHGRSDPSDALGWDTLADDLVSVTRALALERPVVVGQSWGGNVVLELALRHPTAVCGVTCIDGGWIELAERYPSWEACWSALAPPDWDAGIPWARVEEAVRMRCAGWPAEAAEAQLANLVRRPDGTATAVLRRYRHQAILRLLHAHRPSAAWDRLTVPALLLPVLHDEQGRDGTTRSGVEAAVASGARVRVHPFEGADHDVHAQQPHAVATVLREALVDGFLAGDPATVTA